MRPTYRLDRLGEADIARWDALVRPFASCELFHRTAWLEYLAASRGVTPSYWSLSSDDGVIGYFCGGVFRKGPFRVLGSPLRGWGTNFMGPVADALDTAAFVTAVDALARAERFAMVELESRLLEPTAMRAAGYAEDRTAKFVVRLDPANERAMWDRLEPTRSSGIRKAMKHGLVVEDTDDGAVADEFYDQYLEVMRRKRLHPPYPRATARLLFEHLRKADQLLAIRVRDAAGRVIATGLFPHDGKTMYFWGGASTEEAYNLAANEFMHWHAMRLATQKGVETYDMSGNGMFKKKFGGELVELRRWSRCYSTAARWGRKAYVFMFNQGLKLRGRLPRRLARVRAGGRSNG